MNALDLFPPPCSLASENSPINPTCLASEEYTVGSVRYRAEAYRYHNQPGEEIVYTGYKMEFSNWIKVPCFTGSDEARYPKRLAKLGTELVAIARAALKGATK